MIDITALGEILIDFTPNGTNQQGISLFAQNPGGAPANVLAMNAKLGGTSAFIGKVGSDAFGIYLKKILKKHKINTDGLVSDTKVPTTLAFVQLDETGDRSFTFYRNPGADLCLTKAEVNKELIDICKVFHFGSLSLTDDPCRTAVIDAVGYAKNKGKIISFDPNYRPLLWSDSRKAKELISSSIGYADILKVSEEEMTLITDETDPEKGSAVLLNMGPKCVFVTLGEKGACFRNHKNYGFVPAFTVSAKDTTGAGDAFMGTILWQLKDKSKTELEFIDLNEVTAFANAAGGLTATEKGAIPSLPSYEEIQQLIKNQS